MYKLLVAVTKAESQENITLIPAGWLHKLPAELMDLPDMNEEVCAYDYPELHTALKILDYVAEGITARRPGWDFPQSTLTKLSEHRQWLIRLLDDPEWLTRVWLIDVDCSVEHSITLQLAERLPTEKQQLSEDRYALMYGRTYEQCTPEIEVTIPPLDVCPETARYSYRDYLTLLELYDVEPGVAVRLHPRNASTLLSDLLSSGEAQCDIDLNDMDVVPYYVVVTDRH